MVGVSSRKVAANQPPLKKPVCLEHNKQAIHCRLALSNNTIDMNTTPLSTSRGNDYLLNNTH